jgi:hypothetical protein
LELYKNKLINTEVLIQLISQELSFGSITIVQQITETKKSSVVIEDITDVKTTKLRRLTSFDKKVPQKITYDSLKDESFVSAYPTVTKMFDDKLAGRTIITDPQK